MLLKISDLTLSFEGLIASKEINLDVEKGTITALIGPNGAGKTTLFNQIAGAIKPDSGKIIFNEEDITGLKPHEICSKGIARTYQVIKLFNKMTVLDNVLVGMHTINKRSFITDVLKTKKVRNIEKECLNEAHKILDFLNIDNLWILPAESLSYGQQRLLEIARALASKPKLLLLDEPAAGMNEKEKLDLSDMIKKIVNTGITVLIVEHDVKMVMNLADKIYVLNSGEKLAEGSPNEIANNKAVIEAYLGLEELV